MFWSGNTRSIRPVFPPKHWDLPDGEFGLDATLTQIRQTSRQADHARTDFAVIEKVVALRSDWPAWLDFTCSESELLRALPPSKSGRLAVNRRRLVPALPPGNGRGFTKSS
jgi:hypothetical protein